MNQMKKAILLLIFTLIVVISNAQCAAPSGLTAKQGDIIFAPTANTSVYEIYVDGSVMPVSTPTSTDKFGNIHYS